MPRTILRRCMLISISLLAASSTHAAGKIDCGMTFTLSGWSVLYKTAAGSGTIRCSNGQSMNVKLSAKGGGLTVGKSTIEDGKGEFSGVSNLDELLGDYAAAEAHAGAIKSATANVMTKGEVSLALSGKGRGWDIGVAFGVLKIERN